MSAAEMVARRVEGFTALRRAGGHCPNPWCRRARRSLRSGCEIAAACDLNVLRRRRPAFKYPEVGWGTVGATQRLPRIVGRRMAGELLFTGRTVDAQEALRLGLVNHVYEPRRTRCRGHGNGRTHRGRQSADRPADQARASTRGWILRAKAPWRSSWWPSSATSATATGRRRSPPSAGRRSDAAA